MRALKWLGLAVAAGDLLLGSAAEAAVIVIPIDTGPFSLPGNPVGAIPAGTYFEGSNTYDLTFTTVGPVYDTRMQLQATTVGAGGSSDIAFALFRGAPGSGVFVANSGGPPTAPTLQILTAGSYYMEVNTLSAPREQVTRGVTLLSALSAAPEPEGWALMLFGFGALGAVVRGRRRRGACVNARA
jgi:hypothetical protein